MIEEGRDLHEEPPLVTKGTLDIKYDTLYTRIITPLGEESSLELHFGDIGTVDSMDRDDPLSYRSDDATI